MEETALPAGVRGPVEGPGSESSSGCMLASVRYFRSGVCKADGPIACNALIAGGKKDFFI